MNGLTVRRAVASDAQAVFDAERLYIDCPWTKEQIEREIDSPSALFVVAELNGEFAGYLSGAIAADECEVSNIAVLERFRRQKVASGLFAEFVALASETGVKTLYLLVRNDNAPAIALYKKFGFAIVGERKNYYANGDAYIMKSEI